MTIFWMSLLEKIKSNMEEKVTAYYMKIDLCTQNCVLVECWRINITLHKDMVIEYFPGRDNNLFKGI